MQTFLIHQSQIWFSPTSICIPFLFIFSFFFVCLFLLIARQSTAAIGPLHPYPQPPTYPSFLWKLTFAQAMGIDEKRLFYVIEGTLDKLCKSSGYSHFYSDIFINVACHTVLKPIHNRSCSYYVIFINFPQSFLFILYFTLRLCLYFLSASLCLFLSLSVCFSLSLCISVVRSSLSISSRYHFFPVIYNFLCLHP